MPPLKKAKMSLEKSQIKELMKNYAVEVQTSELEDLALDNVSNNCKNVLFEISIP